MRQRISLSEPITELRRVPIVECGEELVNFLALCPELRLRPPFYRYRRETLLRRSVAEKLCEAGRRLRAQGYGLLVVEGWRAPHIQRRMYQAMWSRFAGNHPDWSDVKLKRVVNRFTAPLDPRVPPPHTTGGAVDVALCDAHGREMDHQSPYELWDPHSFPFAAPGLSETARRTRVLLAEALLSTGLTNYPSEYWHWSYGDQGWAYRGGHPYALYNAITPPDWQPDPDDLSDAPLEPVA